MKIRNPSADLSKRLQELLDHYLRNEGNAEWKNASEIKALPILSTIGGTCFIRPSGEGVCT